MPDETAQTPRRRTAAPPTAKVAAAKPPAARPAPPTRPPGPAGRATVPGRGCRCGEPSAAARVGRVAWMVLWAAALPFRIAAWLLEAAVAAAMVGAMAVAWAWWTGRIADDQVAEFLGQLGARGLSVLLKSGIL